MSGSHGSRGGAEAGFSGLDDGRDDALRWTQHPTYVTSFLQQEHSGFDNINSPAAFYPMSPEHTANPAVTSGNTWPPQGTLDLSYASLDSTSGPPLSLTGLEPLSTPVDPHPGGLGNTALWGTVPSDDHNYQHPPAFFMPTLPLAPHPKLPKEGWTQAQQDMLIQSRQAGRGFVDIAEDMRLRFGVEITPNALVKRFGKIQETHLGPLSTAINNAKPDIMACIKTELDKLGYDALPPADKKALDEIMQDFHRSIPKLVQNRVYRKRKAEQSLSSSFIL